MKARDTQPVSRTTRIDRDVRGSQKRRDPSLPAEQIRAQSEAFCRHAPGFKPIAQYQEEIAAKMGLKKP